MVAATHAEVAKRIAPGVTTKALNKVADEFIHDNGGYPTFKGYNGFPAALCMSENEKVVHGFPSEYELRDGDILSVDCGVTFNGFVGDSAFTYGVGEVTEDTWQMMLDTIDALYLGIEQAVIGNRIGDISYAIQKHTEMDRGYGVVRELVGHGVGFRLHEDPEVPNFGRRGRGKRIREGLVIAIEPMINLGTRKIKVLKDNWTVITADKQPSAHFEHTVAVTKNGPEILSDFEVIYDVIKNNDNVQNFPEKVRYLQTKISHG